MSVDALFRPFTVKGLTLPNRIVMAPMTRSFSPNGIPTSDVAGYYRRRAEGGVGLTINTDGPEMYKTNLYKELEFLKDNKIFSQSQLNEFMRNAFRASFIK